MKRTTGILLSPRAKQVTEWFGVEGANLDAQLEVKVPDLSFTPGTITLVTGPSGSGKSSLLRAIRRKRRDLTWIDVDRIRLPDRMVVDCFGDDRLEEILHMLGRLGLGEVWTYLRTPSQLSVGQRWRLRWAIALWQARHQTNAVITSDEFCSVLDPTSAKIVSRCLRRTVDQLQTAAALAATARGDLEKALNPDLLVRCDFGDLSLETRRHEKMEKLKRP